MYGLLNPSHNHFDHTLIEYDHHFNSYIAQYQEGETLTSGYNQTHSGPTGSDPQGSRYNQEKLCQHRKKHRYNKKRHQHYKCIPSNRLLSFTDPQPKTLLG